MKKTSENVLHKFLELKTNQAINKHYKVSIRDFICSELKDNQFIIKYYLWASPIVTYIKDDKSEHLLVSTYGYNTVTTRERLRAFTYDFPFNLLNTGRYEYSFIDKLTGKQYLIDYQDNNILDIDLINNSIVYREYTYEDYIRGKRGE